MLEESIIDLIMAFYSVVIVIIFLIMYKKGGIPFLWLLGSILNSFASAIFYFRYFDDIYRIIGNIFYFLGAISFGYSIFQEFRELSSDSTKKLVNPEKISLNLVLFVSFSFLLINIIQISLSLFAFWIVIMLIKIYWKKKTITHLFMLIAIFSAFLTLIFSILSNINVTGAWETAYIMKLIYYTSVLATGLSAPIEERLNKSEKRYFEAYNRAEFYKDLFAHDISNILQGVQSAMDLLPFYSETQDNKDEFYNLIDIVKNQINRGSDLVSNIRQLSEIEEVDFSIESIEMCVVLKQALENLKKTYESKNINVQFDISDKHYFVKGNKLLLNVFENILVNSIKYNNNLNIEIIVRISRIFENNIHLVKIEFIDNGIGIPNNMKDKVFQRAFMKDRTVSGMGLGLSLIKKIIEKYNGHIWVEDRIKEDYAKGSNFIIIIPEAN